MLGKHFHITVVWSTLPKSFWNRWFDPIPTSISSAPMIYGAALQNARVNSRERQDKVLALRMFTFCLGRPDMPMQTVTYCKAMWE